MERSESTMLMATVVGVLVVLPTALLVLIVMVLVMAMSDPLHAPVLRFGPPSSQPERQAQTSTGDALVSLRSTQKQP